MMEVQAWVEQVIIPTYKTGEPEKNPMFLEKRVYQGSSGVVYPHPVIESIADDKTDVAYTAVFLENEYLKIMLLPQLGGRVQRAYDKVKNRDFVYYNQVIKPALVGLAGPWISGGIEFNWPQHHRPSTFLPVDHAIEEHADGSKTVWMNEVEVMFRTKGRAGFTLHSGKAYLEISGRLFNRTPFPQTFLWWANPAVKVNEHYQSIFPPDVYAVFDHGKRDVSDFPIATGTYYKVDYSPGTDISRYDTIPVPTSYMAIQSAYNFMGCYEHDTQAGMLHVADHHFSPGKKQWTWGNGDFGYAWDRNLTDEDGPYIELMTGVFTDNQPDFSWLHPNEEKSFEQYFMPYAGIGGVKNATKEAMINVAEIDDAVKVSVYATAVYEDAQVRITQGGQFLQAYTATIAPDKLFSATFALAEGTAFIDCEIVVTDSKGSTLVSYKPEPVEKKDIPAPASPALPPAEIEQVEDLYLNGLHLEQYRHATYNPVDYYREGLRRSPGDVRCNNAMGLLLLRKGQFAQAEAYFRTAIATLTKRNPNPYDSEPYYNLGWSLKLQERNNEAYDAFYKATWNDAYQHSGFLALARIATLQGNYTGALQLIENSLVKNSHSHIARHLKAVLLRKLGQLDACNEYIEESLKTDLFNYGCLFEKYLVVAAKEGVAAADKLSEKLKELMRGNLNNFLELSLDYAQAGLYTDAQHVLSLYIAGQENLSPMVYYYQGWFAAQNQQPEEAQHYFSLAATQSSLLVFPNKIEEVLILQSALNANPDDAVAAYLLGNLWYDKRQYEEAIAAWEQSARSNPGFPTVLRNLSLAYYNKLGKKEQALAYMEQAFALDATDARVLMELDQLYKIMDYPFRDRLERLKLHHNLVLQRDDLYLELITLHNNLGQFDTARKLLVDRHFHPWEGGEGKLIGQFLLCHLELAKQAISAGEYAAALEYLKAVEHYPANLGEGKLYNAAENHINFLLGCVYEKMDMHQEATASFEKASKGQSEPVQAIYYNDTQPDIILYQALAWIKLGHQTYADNIFKRFIDFGLEHEKMPVSIDYFAVSLPDMLVFDVDLDLRNRVFCKYITALGFLGLGDYEAGTGLLHEVLVLDINHQGAATNLRMMPFFKEINSGYR